MRPPQVAVATAVTSSSLGVAAVAGLSNAGAAISSVLGEGTSSQLPWRGSVQHSSIRNRTSLSRVKTCSMMDSVREKRHADNWKWRVLALEDAALLLARGNACELTRGNRSKCMLMGTASTIPQVPAEGSLSTDVGLRGGVPRPGKQCLRRAPRGKAQSQTGAPGHVRVSVLALVCHSCLRCTYAWR